MKSIQQRITDAENASVELFKQIDATALKNQRKVLQAFRNRRISYRHFAPTTGYGYDDVGRDALCDVYADAFGAEAALVSPHIVSGTHALSTALFGLLRTGDTLLCISGAPYDTLKDVIVGQGNGSLRDYGVHYRELELLPDGSLNFASLGEAIRQFHPRVVMLTRSRGYAWRDAISLQDIEKCADFIKKLDKSVVFFVDNCYGEFVGDYEPVACGADVMAGSCIKNPGGGLAPTGGYAAGRRDLVEKIADRLTAPSLGMEVGSYAASYRPFYQGLFLAPTTVANALKGSVLAGRLFADLGFAVNPAPDRRPGDLIRAIRFGSPELLVNFCQKIQGASPVDSFALPEFSDMPGYEDPIIMSAGTFVAGASIELTADSPLKEPYIAYLQGGLTYEHCKIALEEVLQGMQV